MTLLRTLTPTQRCLLVAAFAVTWMISFTWWTGNQNRAFIIAAAPEWDFDGFVMYDGYGNYAEVLHRAMASPGAESWGELRAFVRSHIHAYRPMFPLLVALMRLVVPDLVVAALLVNALASIAALAMIAFLANRHFGLEGTALFSVLLVAISHVSIGGMLARPMSDALALFLQLAAMSVGIDFARNPSARRFGILLGIVALALLTKTANSLLLVALPLGLVPLGNGSRAAVVKRLALLLLGCAVIVAVGVATVALLAPYHAAAQWTWTVVRGVTMHPFDSAWLRGFVIAAGFFLVIALQPWPLFWAWSGGALRDVSRRVHVAWAGCYVFQRLLFYGFSLTHSRARYGIPLVPAAVLLGYTGILRRFGPRAAHAMTAFVVAANYALWAFMLWRET